MGTVDQAASLDLLGVACAGSSTYRFSSSAKPRSPRVFSKVGAGRGVGMVLLELLQRVIGDDAVADPGFRLVHEIEDAGDLLVDRAGADQPHHPGDIDRIMRRMVLHVREGRTR